MFSLTHVCSYEGRGRKPLLADEIFPATPASNVCKATPRFPTDLKRITRSGSRISLRFDIRRLLVITN